MTPRDKIIEAKRRLPLPDLMRKIGDEAHAKRSARCPFHDDAENSFSVFRGHGDQWFWKCHTGCGKGDAVDYLEKRFDLSTRDAIRRYLTEAGVNNGQAKSAPKAHTPFNWQACVDAFHEDDTLDLAAWRGLTPEFVRWLHSKRIVGLHDGKLAFAVHDQSGKVASCHKLTHREKRKWAYEPKGKGTHPLVLGDIRRAGFVLCFESQWDAFAVMDRLDWHTSDGLPNTAVVITRGSENGKLIAGQCSPEAIVYAFIQNDAPKADGSIPAEKWLADVAASAGCKVLRVMTPAAHKDPNDWTRAGATKREIETAMLAGKPVCSNASLASVLNDPRPKVQLPGDNRIVSEFAREIGKHLANVDLFRRDTYAVTINYRRDGLEIMTPDLFRTWIEKHVVCFKVRVVGKNIMEFDRTMTKEDANAVLRSSQFLEELRPIERFNTVRLPVLRANGKVELLAEGYDTEAKVYTASQLFYREDMTLSEGKAVLDDLHGEFVFADPGRSRAVAVASMLTLYAYGLLPLKSLRPVFISVANDIGAGKTTILKCAVVPVCGHGRVKSEPKDDDEIRKSLLTAVMEARPYVFFDNVKAHLTSPSLEAFATATGWEDRILGKSKTFAGDNCSTVFISGNTLTVSSDLARRALFIELFQELERPQDHQYKRELDDTALFKMRADILAALWALVREWHAAGQPPPSRSSSSFPAWARTIGGIVEHAGYGCPLETAVLETSGDRDAADMHTLVCQSTPGEAFTFSALVKVARQQGLFERLVPTTAAEDELDPKQRSALGNLFRRYHRRLFNDGTRRLRFTVEGKGHNRRFYVREE